MRDRRISITEGPWPAHVSECLTRKGIVRWQVLKRKFGEDPGALIELVPGTTAEEWAAWFEALPDVMARPPRDYAMGLIPTPDPHESVNTENNDDEDEATGVGERPAP